MKQVVEVIIINKLAKNLRREIMTNSLKEEQGKLVIDFVFGKEEIAKASDKAVNQLSQHVTVPGFRKGKAPVKLASRYLRNEEVVDETINQMLRMIDKTVESDENISPFFKEGKVFTSARPTVNVKKFELENGEIEVSFVLKPVVSKLGNYKGLSSSAEKKEITEADVNKELETLANNEAELAPKDKEAEKGDTANIDFVGLMNGKEFDGGSAKAFDLVLGSNQFVPGFENQVIGHKAGDKFDVALTMPENYPAPLTSKPVVFKVTLNSVKVKEVPEINDEFATTLSGEYASKDLAELKTKVVEKLNKDAEAEYLRHLTNDLLLQVRDGSEFVISDEYLDFFVNDRIAQDEKNITNQGLSLDEYLKLIKKDMKDYREEIKAGVLAEIKNSLVFSGIMEAEKIPAVNEKDIEAELGSSVKDFVNGYSNYLSQSKMPKDQIQGQIYGYLNQIASEITTRKVQDRILVVNGFKEEAKAEEKEADEKKEEVKEEVKEETKAEEAKAE